MAAITQSQIEIGNTILSVGRSLGATAHQIRAAFAAAWVESEFRNLNYGDRDSVGVFQQRPSQGWGTPAQIRDVGYAARKFFETAMRVSQSGTAGQLAQRVQRSAYPNRYDEQIANADSLLAIVSGGQLDVSSFNLGQIGTGAMMLGFLALFLILDRD